MIDSNGVASAHDLMAGEYDEMEDLWYPWLFARIHDLIARNIPRERTSNLAVDAGCGTGFQSFLLAQVGFEVRAFDISERLLDAARKKSPRYAVRPLDSPPLFRSRCSRNWIVKWDARQARWLEELRSGRSITPPNFIQADIHSYDFGRDLDVITCCGSVLSFIDRYPEAIRRMAGALRYGGRLFLEMEQKRNLDLLWPILDRMTRGRLDFQQPWGEIFSNLFSGPGRSVRVDYPFQLKDGQMVLLPIWLFSVRELARIFRESGLQAVEKIGIHHVTNVIPSTLLHQSPPSPFLRAIFEPLRRMDNLLGRVWPFWRLGCSVAYCLEKRSR